MQKSFLFLSSLYISFVFPADKGEDSGMESRGDHRIDVKDISEMSLGESRLSVLAKKGPIQVYIAKYSYDPYQYSPNENPEAELPLHSGDYVLIYGEMDEVSSFCYIINWVKNSADDILKYFSSK